MNCKNTLTNAHIFLSLYWDRIKLAKYCKKKWKLSLKSSGTFLFLLIEAYNPAFTLASFEGGYVADVKADDMKPQIIPMHLRRPQAFPGAPISKRSQFLFFFMER